MDIKQYIESGVLELYVLGRLTESEAQEVENKAAQHPEVAAEISDIEQTLEEAAQATAPPVNPEILERTLRDIRDGDSGSTNAPPASDTAGFKGWLPWLFALTALLASGLLWNSNRISQLEQEALRQELQTLRDDCATISTQSEANENVIAALTRPATRAITLEATENAPGKRAVVFYNEEEEAAYFSASNLPSPPSGKQYQLWGIDGDGPKSLGVLDLNLEAGTILNLDYLPGVAAFAITLEDLGGKEAPDLTQLQVIGEV